MNEEFVLADHIIPICLPKDLNILTQISKSDCITAGWGKDVLGKVFVLFSVVRFSLKTSNL